MSNSLGMSVIYFDLDNALYDNHASGKLADEKITEEIGLAHKTSL